VFEAGSASKAKLVELNGAALLSSPEISSSLKPNCSVPGVEAVAVSPIASIVLAPEVKVVPDKLTV